MANGQPAKAACSCASTTNESASSHSRARAGSTGGPRPCTASVPYWWRGGSGVSPPQTESRCSGCRRSCARPQRRGDTAQPPRSECHPATHVSRDTGGVRDRAAEPPLASRLDPALVGRRRRPRRDGVRLAPAAQCTRSRLERH
eukprot:scaffold31198_cov36-Phaeocystis_antarctica.AAC.3